MKKHDITIIGSGPGGYVAAIRAAQLGQDVAIIEKEAVGGVCLNWGCIPTKALLKSAKVYDLIKHAKDYGIKIDMKDVSYDFPDMIHRKDKIVKRLTGGVSALLKKNNVTLYMGEAKAIDNHTVKVNDETIKTKKLIIATGASPAFPPIDGLKEAFDKGIVVTSKEILDLKKQPKELVVIGGGVIGLEFATVFNTLGTKVTVIERLDDILVSVDQEVKNVFKKKIKKDGINVLLNAAVTKIDGNKVTYKLDGEEKTIQGDNILLSVGMKANLKGFEALNLTIEKGCVVTNEYMQTNVEDVYAIGDVNGKFMLAHVASKEGTTAVEHIAGNNHPLNYKIAPAGIYTFPEIAQVGITEEEAKSQKLDYLVQTFPLSANGKALAEGEAEGLMKIIASKQYNEILGVHILAPSATEMISEAVLGMTLETTADDIVAGIHPHPTLSEMMHEVAHGIVDKPIHI
ncbi:dihydrolipoyl dehydrogenase [Liberiplasma polymorphum]|uniref:dihydrolipoyl dehydrogenase n=1 Tax=Liberiplasma polymorphum TaxID=3374570 RepID=UPI00377231F8